MPLHVSITAHDPAAISGLVNDLTEDHAHRTRIDPLTGDTHIDVTIPKRLNIVPDWAWERLSVDTPDDESTSDHLGGSVDLIEVDGEPPADTASTATVAPLTLEGAELLVYGEAIDRSAPPEQADEEGEQFVGTWGVVPPSETDLDVDEVSTGEPPCPEGEAPVEQAASADVEPALAATPEPPDPVAAAFEQARQDTAQIATVTDVPEIEVEDDLELVPCPLGPDEPMTERLLALLEANPHAQLNAAAACVAIGEPVFRQKSVGQTLANLHKAGRIHRADHGWYQALGAGAEAPVQEQKLPVRATVRDFLAAHPARSWSPIEVAEQTGLDEKQARSALSQMAAAGQVDQLFRGQYRHIAADDAVPFDGDTVDAGTSHVVDEPDGDSTQDSSPADNPAAPAAAVEPEPADVQHIDGPLHRQALALLRSTGDVWDFDDLHDELGGSNRDLMDALRMLVDTTGEAVRVARGRYQAKAAQ